MPAATVVAFFELCRIQISVTQDCAQGLHELHIQLDMAITRHGRQHAAQSKLLRSFPTVEGVQIVGDPEADIKSGLISVSSPIARALIGKEEGDTAEVQAPGGIKRYEIVAVSYL